MISGANQHDKWSVAHLVFHVVVKRPTTEQHFCADKGYDYGDVFEVVLRQGYIPHIKHRRLKNEPPDPYPVPGELGYPSSTLGGRAHTRLAGQAAQPAHPLVQEVQQLAGLRSAGLRQHLMRHGSFRIDS